MAELPGRAIIEIHSSDQNVGIVTNPINFQVPMNGIAIDVLIKALQRHIVNADSVQLGHHAAQQIFQKMLCIHFRSFRRRFCFCQHPQIVADDAAGLRRFQVAFKSLSSIPSNTLLVEG